MDPADGAPNRTKPKTCQNSQSGAQAGFHTHTGPRPELLPCPGLFSSRRRNPALTLELVLCVCHVPMHPCMPLLHVPTARHYCTSLLHVPTARS